MKRAHLAAVIFALALTNNISYIQAEELTSLEEKTTEQTVEQTVTTKKRVKINKTEEIEKISEEDYIPVLMYHHFTKDKIEPGNGATVNIDEFEEHLNTFIDAGYTIISLEEMDKILLSAIDEKKEKPFPELNLDKKYLCITMDDGYRSNYELAYPLLLKYNVKADISVITHRIHKEYVIAPEIDKLSWSDLNVMRESGLVNVYTHSYDHLPANLNDISYFRDNVLKSEEELDKRLTDRGDFRVLTYPNGAYTGVSQTIMRQLGYDIQLSTEYGVINRNTLVNNIPRITVDSGETGEKVLEKIQNAAIRTFGK